MGAFVGVFEDTLMVEFVVEDKGEYLDGYVYGCVRGCVR